MFIVICFNLLVLTVFLQDKIEIEKKKKLEKCPILSNIIRCASAFDPAVMPN